MLTHSRAFGYTLWLFLGLFGVHRFYYGRRASGLLYMLTLGVFGIGWIADAFLIPRLADGVQRRYQAGTYSYATGWSLLLVLGLFGAHRFYMGHWKSGLLYALTLGGLGVGVIHDLFTLNEMLSEANEAWVTSPPRRSSVPAYV